MIKYRQGGILKKSIKIFCVFLLCIFLIFIILSVTFSKYTSKIETNVKSSIAYPVIYIENTDYQDIDVLGNKSISYNFSVKNYNDNNSDVSFKYNLLFEYSQENAPILINLYKKDRDGEKQVELLRKQNSKF